MKEKGQVVKTDGKFATVKVMRKDECSKCGMCGFSKNDAFLEIVADNKRKAKVGDTVTIEIEKDNKLLSVFLLFVVPLLLLLAIILINKFTINSEIFLLAGGLGSVVLWYTILVFIDKKLSKISGFCPIIIEIEGETNE